MGKEGRARRFCCGSHPCGSSRSGPDGCVGAAPKVQNGLRRRADRTGTQNQRTEPTDGGGGRRSRRSNNARIDGEDFQRRNAPEERECGSRRADRGSRSGLAVAYGGSTARDGARICGSKKRRDKGKKEKKVKTRTISTRDNSHLGSYQPGKGADGGGVKGRKVG